jgi:hypothetical protein
VVDQRKKESLFFGKKLTRKGILEAFISLSMLYLKVK